MRFTALALIVELVALGLFVMTVFGAGSVGLSKALAQLLAGPYGIAFWLGAIVVGLVVPLALQFGGAIRNATPGMAALVSALILVGGFILKYAIIAAGQLGGT
jgi:formate-dependent nitrite reductase membrane component NrfD